MCPKFFWESDFPYRGGGYPLSRKKTLSGILRLPLLLDHFHPVCYTQHTLSDSLLPSSCVGVQLGDAALPSNGNGNQWKSDRIISLSQNDITLSSEMMHIIIITKKEKRPISPFV